MLNSRNDSRFKEDDLSPLSSPEHSPVSSVCSDRNSLSPKLLFSLSDRINTDSDSEKEDNSQMYNPLSVIKKCTPVLSKDSKRKKSGSVSFDFFHFSRFKKIKKSRFGNRKLFGWFAKRT